jgi:protein-S-isoprenylcysteine O-methyltransferase Ste14
LNTSGIRCRVRHPYYLGHLCELLGWTLGTGLLVLYALAIFAVVTGAVMITSEERELESRFGQPYRDYKQRVPAILPRL